MLGYVKNVKIYHQLTPKMLTNIKSLILSCILHGIHVMMALVNPN